MPIAYTRRKIAYLRQQPEHVRLRAASIMTAVSGIVLVGLWLTVLLPLQLHFNQPHTNSAQPVVTDQAVAPTPLTDSRVSGARDRVLPTSQVMPTDLPTIMPSSLPTITPTSDDYSAPVEIQP